ncbi:MAG: radical SAM protein [Chloroflexota bacterium]
MTHPIYVDWAITSACNLNCRHCVGMEQGELSNAEAVKIAQDIIKLAPRWVILEGGEPLLRPDLSQISGMFNKAKIDVFIITNGNAFNQDNLDRLATFSPKVLFSIDGANADTYEYTKLGAKFDVATKWARKCAARGIFYGLTVVLSRLNLSQIKGFIRLTEELGGKQIYFLPLKPFGKDEVSHQYYRENALNAKEHEEAIKEIYSLGSDLDIYYDEPFLWNLSARDGFALSSRNSGITIPEIKGCASTFSLYIQTDGSVRPCMFSPQELTFGNAAKESLEKIWLRMKQSAVLTGWTNQSARKGACGKCPEFESCRGCLARTTILKRDTLAADPICPLSRKSLLVS